MLCCFADAVSEQNPLILPFIILTASPLTGQRENIIQPGHYVHYKNIIMFAVLLHRNTLFFGVFFLLHTNLCTNPIYKKGWNLALGDLLKSLFILC